MNRQELIAISRYQQKSAYQQSDTAQRAASMNPALTGVAAGTDPSTGRQILKTSDGGTIQGTSIAKSPLSPGAVVPATLSGSAGVVLDSF